MASKRKPDRTEVCIIGAGASGAAAAKVLCEAGVRVVALERGPWRHRESFGGDELANINRYNLWPDPILNPRTWRETEGEPARTGLFCPVPQMVGGGTVHWQGWLPRFTPNDFRLRTIAGDLPGASLADWPITYDELEPYYTKVEWAFGVSGEAGANRFEGPRSKAYPCPPMPVSRYAQKFHKGCAALGWNSFPLPQAALSRPFNGRPATVVSAFAQQHGDPTGTRSSALNVFVPDAVRTGRYDLRPDCTVRELVADPDGRVTAALYDDAEGDTIEQEADIFILACGAVETARLMLLSRSARFPNGLANGNDLVGRNVTFHEYSAAVGVYDDPIYAWAGGGYVSASSFEHYEHNPKRNFVSGGHIAVAGSAFRCPSIGAFPARRPGAPRQSGSIAMPSTIRSRSPWSCTTCPSIATASTSTRAWSTPGVFPSRGSRSSRTGTISTRAATSSIGAPMSSRRAAQGRSRRSMPIASPAIARISTVPFGWATIPTRRCSTAGAARTKSATSTWSTARLSPPRPAPTLP